MNVHTNKAKGPSKVNIDSVRFSNAGDTFHYRWAARRCLRLLNPRFNLSRVVIEGTKDRVRGGELAVDVAEYYRVGPNEIPIVVYYQLKHSIKMLDKPYTLSDIENTITGFSERFRAHRSSKDIPVNQNYVVLSNRPASPCFKKNLMHLSSNSSRVEARFVDTLMRYTGMKGEDLTSFVSRLAIIDGEGDYIEQHRNLNGELTQLLAGTVDKFAVDNLVNLVSERALPDSDGEIIKEDVLQRLGCSSERDLFPAPPTIELVSNPVRRHQQDAVIQSINNSVDPVVIHAEGGIGKSTFALQLSMEVSDGSKSVFYDCFGSGKYRNRSEPRHRCRDALVQIANEVFSLGLCEPLIPRDTDHDDALFRALKDRLETAVAKLRQVNASANLIVIVDAADNAEMAAKEVADQCFVHQLVREQMPDGVKFVFVSRTERLELLKLPSTAATVQLEPFQLGETFSHVRTVYPSATESQMIEFHHLTSKNPRIQALFLDLGCPEISSVLLRLGPDPISVSDQINKQLDLAMARLKDALPTANLNQLDAICFGLANLPPSIPLEVLSAATKVDVASIKSFISDLGTPLWLTDSSVLFRDEPTESWFRERFDAGRQQLKSFIERISPLANDVPYVSSALPALLLQADMHTELMELALSESHLPKDNPIDARNIRLYRLQFAFRAALDQSMLVHACQLALLAGEESAGEDRQLDLLRENLDLVCTFQSKQGLQDLAYERAIAGDWLGSENVYSASLLSVLPDVIGEAGAYLRSARNWLSLYFESRDRADEEEDRFGYEQRLDVLEIVEMATAVHNLYGEEAVGSFFFSWRPTDVVWKVGCQFARRLVDAGRVRDLDEIVEALPDDDQERFALFCLAANDQLWQVGKTLHKKHLRRCLNLLLHHKIQLPEQLDSTEFRQVHTFASFAEACASRGISKRKIASLIRRYIGRVATSSEISEHDYSARYEFLRNVALDVVLRGRSKFRIEELLPKDWIEEDETKPRSRELRMFRELIGGTFSWYLIRARRIVGNVDGLEQAIETAQKESSSVASRIYSQTSPLRYEINKIRLAQLGVVSNPKEREIDRMTRLVGDRDQYIWLNDLISALRFAQRLNLSDGLFFELETRVRECIEQIEEDGPSEKANHYVGLARAVLAVNPNDSAAYFRDALDVVSELGDEMIERWRAVAAVGKRFSESRDNNAEIAFRFIRCAELIGCRVAREKYLDRDGAIVTCSRIEPTQALAVLSRWRDRDVGEFERQLGALGGSLIEQKQLSAAAAWALTGFESCRIDSSYASYFVNNSSNSGLNTHVFKNAVDDSLLGGTTALQLDLLRDASDLIQGGNTSREMAKLEEAVSFWSEVESHSQHKKSPHLRRRRDETGNDFDSLLLDLDLGDPQNIPLLLDRLNELELPRHFDRICERIYEILPRNSAIEFLDSLFGMENVTSYDLEHAIKSLPDRWKNSRALEDALPQLTRRLSSKFAPEYCSSYRISRLIEISGGLVPFSDILRGVMDGLRSLSYSLSASGFSSFVESAIQLIPANESFEVLDFALQRFELHIPPEFGDGPWRNSMVIEGSSVASAFAGFLWSTLASPRAEVRWQATHSVRRLIEAGGSEELRHLISFADSNDASPFYYDRFPFYDLHARLYLLIAISRVSIDSCTLIRDHVDWFCTLALCDPPHALIRLLAASIALRIEGENPGTIEGAKLDLLRKVGVSDYPTLPKDCGTQLTPWHESLNVDTSIDLDVAYDFERYWFESLARVFKIPSTQVGDLVKQTMVKRLNVQPREGFLDDPRGELWNAYRGERETWHSHGSYPKTDDYSFYLSYHSLFMVADELLMNMPTVETDWDFDRWDHWIHRHLLTREDGRWVSDRRDPRPLETRPWINERDNDEWRWRVVPNDFLDCLLKARNGETWLVCDGSWIECESYRAERFQVTSALVSPEASLSLLAALTTSLSPLDYKIPEYAEDRIEIDNPPFQLHGWICNPETETQLDRFDTHAMGIPYPPAFVGQEIVGKLGLSVDSEKRTWSLGEVAVLNGEIWGSYEPQYRNDYRRVGKRLLGSLAFLKKLCAVTGKHLIFEIQISRSRSGSYLSSRNDEIGYVFPYSKIYLLTERGVLRDLKKSHQLREVPS